jgi:hypothetical protein
MSSTSALALALVVAALLVAAMRSKPGKALVGGIFQRDRKGRMTLVLAPTPKPKKRRRRK